MSTIPFMRKLCLAMIRLYQWVLSPLLPPACRFEPSCSQYTYEAIARHGIFRGIGLGLRRIVKCAPWHPGGYDPVPPVVAHSASGEQPTV